MLLLHTYMLRYQYHTVPVARTLARMIALLVPGYKMYRTYYRNTYGIALSYCVHNLTHMTFLKLLPREAAAWISNLNRIHLYAPP